MANLYRLRLYRPAHRPSAALRLSRTHRFRSADAKRRKLETNDISSLARPSRKTSDAERTSRRQRSGWWLTLVASLLIILS